MATVSGHGDAVAKIHEEKASKSARLEEAEAEIVEVKKVEEAAETKVAEA